jgi:hypothetical protein
VSGAAPERPARALRALRAGRALPRWPSCRGLDTQRAGARGPRAAPGLGGGRRRCVCAPPSMAAGGARIGLAHRCWRGAGARGCPAWLGIVQCACSAAAADRRRPAAGGRAWRWSGSATARPTSPAGASGRRKLAPRHQPGQDLEARHQRPGGRVRPRARVGAGRSHRQLPVHGPSRTRRAWPGLGGAVPGLVRAPPSPG